MITNRSALDKHTWNVFVVECHRGSLDRIRQIYRKTSLSVSGEKLKVVLKFLEFFEVQAESCFFKFKTR